MVFQSKHWFLIHPKRSRQQICRLIQGKIGMSRKAIKSLPQLICIADTNHELALFARVLSSGAAEVLQRNDQNSARHDQAAQELPLTHASLETANQSAPLRMPA